MYICRYLFSTYKIDYKLNTPFFLKHNLIMNSGRSYYFLFLLNVHIHKYNWMQFLNDINLTMWLIFFMIKWVLHTTLATTLFSAMHSYFTKVMKTRLILCPLNYVFKWWSTSFHMIYILLLYSFRYTNHHSWYRFTVF